MTSFLSDSDIAITIEIDTPVAYGGTTGGNLVANPGFETAGGGGGDVFADWTEDLDSGRVDSITQEATTVRSGSYSCKIANADADTFKTLGGPFNGGVYQNVTVEANRAYRFSVWSRASEEYASMQGRIGIWDVTNSEWIISKEDGYAFSDTKWEEISRFFVTPAGCVSVRIYLYMSHDSSVVAGDTYVLYDDASLRKLAGASSAPAANWGGVGDITSYRHRIIATGGFDTMSIGTVGSSEFLGDWLTDGIGRRVMVREAGAGIIWEGFINEIVINVGGLSVNIGPFMSIINRGRISYSTISFDTTPPIPSEATSSVWHNVDKSQNRFGIMEGVISGGEESPTVMRGLIGSVVEVIAWPEVAEKFTLGTGLDMSLTINCLGYHRLMDKYFYTQAGISGTENLSNKLHRVVSRQPIGLYNVSESSIDTNTTQVGIYENEDRTALDIVKELVSMGDSDYNRYIWGVYENFSFRYEKMTDEVAYVNDLQAKTVENAFGGEVKPWNVRPGKWMYIAGFVTGSPQERFALRDDPRYIFLETVDYVAPYGLSVDSGNANKFKQRLEQLGLGGI